MKATQEVRFSLSYDEEEILTLYSILSKTLSNNSVTKSSCKDVDSLLSTLQLLPFSAHESLLLADILNNLTKILGESGLINFGNPDDEVPYEEI